MKSLSLVLLLTMLTATSQAGEILEAPQLTPLSTELPPLVQMEEGVWVPQPTADALNAERAECKTLTGTCQELLGSQAELTTAEQERVCKDTMAEERSRHDKERNDIKSSSFTLWEVLGVSAGSVAAGFIAGVLVAIFG